MCRNYITNFEEMIKLKLPTSYSDFLRCVGLIKVTAVDRELGTADETTSGGRKALDHWKSKREPQMRW